MNKPHIITISGKPGSGKSSTADRVAELLSYTRHSSGDMVRSMLKKRKLTLEEYNKKAVHDHTLDDEVDQQLRDLRDHSDIVIDSRLGFYWIPESFKVYLDLDLEVATARIYNDVVSNAGRQAAGTSGSSLSEVARQVSARMAGEQARFESLYGVDPFDLMRYDLIIDTSRNDPQMVAINVFDNYKKWLESRTWEQVRIAVPLGYSYKN